MLSMRIRYGAQLGLGLSLAWALWGLAAADARTRELGPADRFERLFGAIESRLPDAGGPLLIASTEDGSLRAAIFAAQAMGKLYAKQDPRFESIRDAMKRLEDALGDVDKWKAVLAYVSSGQAAKDGAIAGGTAEETMASQLRGRISKSQGKLERLLNEEGWVRERSGQAPALSEMRSDLGAFVAFPYAEDRKFLLKRLEKQLASIEATRFDMSILEHGDGVHELRRSLRWFSIQVQALGGLVVAGEGCSAPALESLLTKPIARSKYAKLPSGDAEPRPCGISRCAFLGIVQAVEELGLIKDVAEARNNLSGEESTDAVPAELRARAQAVYQRLQEAGGLSAIRGELAACL